MHNSGRYRGIIDLTKWLLLPTGSHTICNMYYTHPFFKSKIYCLLFRKLLLIIYKIEMLFVKHVILQSNKTVIVVQ